MSTPPTLYWSRLLRHLNLRRLLTSDSKRSHSGHQRPTTSNYQANNHGTVLFASSFRGAFTRPTHALVTFDPRRVYLPERRSSVRPCCIGIRLRGTGRVCVAGWGTMRPLRKWWVDVRDSVILIYSFFYRLTHCMEAQYMLWQFCLSGIGYSCTHSC